MDSGIIGSFCHSAPVLLIDRANIRLDTPHPPWEYPHTRDRRHRDGPRTRKVLHTEWHLTGSLLFRDPQHQASPSCGQAPRGRVFSDN